MLPAQTRPSHTCWVFLAELLTNSPLPINCYLCPRLPYASEIHPRQQCMAVPSSALSYKTGETSEMEGRSRKNLPTFAHNSGSAKASSRPRAPSSSPSQPRAESRCHFVHLMLVKHGSSTVQPRAAAAGRLRSLSQEDGTGGQLCAFAE